MPIVETVVGSIISAALQVLFDRLSSPQVLNFFRRRGFDYTLLERLKTALLTVNAVLSDAEEKQIWNATVKEWVDDLKDAAYHAEDVLDEINTVALRCNAEAEASASGIKVRSSDMIQLHGISEDLGSKVEKITSRLEKMAKQKDVIGLKDRVGSKPMYRVPTTCLIDESEIYGRDNDRKVIVEWLLSDNVGVKETPLIAIVGMGGIGKTVLAQLLYNDTEVRKHFSVRSWVDVSEEFDVFRVSKTIFESVTPKQHCSISDLNMLLLKLNDRLRNKRFLVVLDDIWNQDFQSWDVLRRVFKAGERGSRIIVTTRDESIATTMRAARMYHLPLLSNEYCGLIFESLAFGNERSHKHPKLKLIGAKIVRKCKGLPLAAKTLGALVHSKDEAKEWEKILNSEVWELPNDKSNILPALRLSYHYLPSHLKQCFAYCSIFPKGYAFKKEELVLLWMAEGFLKQQGHKRMEEVGEEYFCELLSRSLFQRASRNSSLFVMHDLVNDLAQFAAGDFCCKCGGDNQQGISERVRHCSFLTEKFGHPKVFEVLHEARNLRTLLAFSLSNSSGQSHLNKTVLQEWLPRMRCLRTLSLSCYGITELPDVFNKLKHIRYLNLSRTLIRQLPNSVCSLYNLETLMLSNCPRLIELPRNMWNLVNLCHLDVSGTKLNGMPLLFGKLKCLQNLSTFFVSNGNGSRISELGGLHLHGKLTILELQNVVDAKEASGANFKNKKYLNELVFSWNTNANSLQEGIDVLEKLQPHEDIEKLTIENYSGAKFPSWLGDASFSNMVFLYLRGCKNCLFLPSLGQLPCLEELYVAKMERLKTVGPEFCGNSASSFDLFRSLRILQFEDMPDWSSFAIAGVEFPSLEEFHVLRCPELTGNLSIYSPSLKKIFIRECRKLDFIIEDMMPICKSLQYLHLISSCDSLMSFPLDISIKLEHLQIVDCKNLKFLEISMELHDKLNFFKIFEIGDCPNLEYFPARWLPTPNLTRFSLRKCVNLKSIPTQMHAVLASVETDISDCPKLQLLNLPL